MTNTKKTKVAKAGDKSPAFVYTGPNYDKSIWLGGGRRNSREVSPRDFTPEQIEEFVQSFPQYTDWFTVAVQASDEPGDTPE
jgi:hypothetical protein